MNKYSNPEDLDARVSEDLFILENWAFAVWGDILASNAGLMRAGSGSIRTIVLSETATLVANAHPSGSPMSNPAQGDSVTHGAVTLDIAFRLHYLASAHHHLKPDEAVKMRWVESCLRVIKKLEKGMVVVIPTSEEIARHVLRGQSAVDMGSGHRLVNLSSGLQMLVWRQSSERVALYAAQRTSHVVPGIFQELTRILKNAPDWN